MGTAGLIGIRYRVVGLLGEGGMGQVLEAFDTVTQEPLALKLLRAGTTPDRDRRLRLFEQEFHTLSQLRHPRVVGVCEFHKDEHGVYYTMELLDGGDLRELAPLPWKRACAVLCDVCSALSLLHSRRLVHRDLTTRNVRCSKDGKAKLIDFGAMAPFGASKHVVGTPAFAAPEVLTGQPLDARTDLFSLGATAYFALSGRHAFPAPTLNAQRNAWRSRPQPPSHFVPDIPKELDDLVMSLLQIAPVARPRSAAEVLERLSVIGEVALDEQVPVRQAYLSTPTLVGRQEPLLRVRKQLLRAMRGRGGAFIITGPRGIGRSRFLEACVLEGKLLGTLVLRADRRDGTRPWGGAHTLLRQLHDFAPELPAPPGLDDDEWSVDAGSRPALQRTLCRHFLQASNTRPLMLAVDDVDGLDEPSSALVALLAETAERHRLSIITTVCEQAGGATARALDVLGRVSLPIALPPLEHEQTLQLLRSVFSDVPNVRLLSERLHASSSGSPQAVMQLAQHVLEHDIVRFEEGTWVLPNDLDAVELPASLKEALRARVDALSEDARWLAQGLSLSGRESLTLSECAVLAGTADTASVLRSLDELVAGSVFDFELDRYAFTQPGWAKPLRRALTPEARQRLHERLAALLERAGEPFRALQHTFWAGRPGEALERLLALIGGEGQQAAKSVGALMGALQHTPAEWRPVMEALIAYSEREKRSREERIKLRLSLVLRAIAFSEPCAEPLEALLVDLHHDSGLDIYEEDDTLPPAARLQAALQAAEQRFEQANATERGLPPREAIDYLHAACGLAVSMAGRTFDCAPLERLPRIGVFAPVSFSCALSDITVRAGLHLCAGRMEQARACHLEVLERHRSLKGGEASDRWHMSYTYGVGMMEAGIGLPSAQDRATLIERDPAFAINAWRIRMVYALRQGDFERADDCERRIELMRLQNAAPAMYDGGYLWPELRSYAAADDLARLKQLLPKIEGMARQLESWAPFLQHARGSYHLLRRVPEGALQEFERGLAIAEPGRHPAWPALAGGCISALCELGRTAEAVERGRSFLEQCRAAELGYQSGFIERALALAETATGEHARAVELATAAIAALDAHGATGLDLGLSCEVRARVAVAMADQESFERFARRCALQYRAGDNPVLTVRYERMLEDARRAGMEVSEGLARAGARPQVGAAAGKVLAALDTCSTPEARAQAALGCLVQNSGAAGGFLYLLREEGPGLAAALCDQEPPTEIDVLVEAYLSAELASTEAVTLSTATESATQSGAMESWHGPGGGAFVPFLLSHVGDSDHMITGLVVLCTAHKAPPVPSVEILPVLSQALCDIGDVTAHRGAC